MRVHGHVLRKTTRDTRYCRDTRYWSDSIPTARRRSISTSVVLGVNRAGRRLRLLRPTAARMPNSINQARRQQHRSNDLDQCQKRHALKGIKHWIPRISPGSTSANDGVPADARARPSHAGWRMGTSRRLQSFAAIAQERHIILRSGSGTVHKRQGSRGVDDVLSTWRSRKPRGSPARLAILHLRQYQVD
jgi:hypothetical protein